MKKIILTLVVALAATAVNAKTLIVYYSYTNNGAQMAGKKIGLIVSSASSGISSVEADAKRLIPNGEFLSQSLWIRSSQVSNSSALISNWLTQINYSIVSNIMEKDMDIRSNNKIYNLNGICIASENPASIPSGIYIVNGKKQIIK